LQDRCFLVGDHFSRADLTACALLSPFVAPGRPEVDIASAFPAPVRALRDELRDRRFFRWVTDTYQACRGGAPASGPRVAQGGRLQPAAPRCRSTSDSA
jgi:glutathione S-transferase